MVNEEKRSTQTEQPASTRPSNTPPPPLGARQEPTPPPDRGGGYLDICSISEADLAAEIRKTDPRLRELFDMGVGADWLKLAEIMGVESFLVLWSILGRDYSYRIRVPCVSRYRKYQRNKRIRELISSGVSVHQVQHIIVKEFREKISIRHIDRISTEVKV